MIFRFQLHEPNQLPSKSERLMQALKQQGEKDDDMLFNVKLVVYELVGNVLKHANHPASVRVALSEGHISVIVKGGDPLNESEQCNSPDLYSENGRGLCLVRHLTDSLQWKSNGSVRAVFNRKKIG